VAEAKTQQEREERKNLFTK